MKKLNEWKYQKKQGNENPTITLDDLPDAGFVKYAKLTVLALLAFAIGYIVLDHIKRPNTYDELFPLMGEALEFDSRVTDYARSYEPIEEQVDEDAYFTALESEYESAAEVQAKMVDDIKEMDAKVKQAGGITNFQELQAIKTTPKDSYAAQQVEEAMETYGKNE